MYMYSIIPKTESNYQNCLMFHVKTFTCMFNKFTTYFNYCMYKRHVVVIIYIYKQTCNHRTCIILAGGEKISFLFVLFFIGEKFLYFTDYIFDAPIQEF